MATTMSSEQATAIIDNALATAPSSVDPGDEAILSTIPPDTSTIMSPPAPETNAANQTPEQAQIAKAQRDLLGDEEAAALEQERLAKAQQAAVLKAAQAATAATKQAATKTGAAIVKLPQPGGIMTPLVILLVLGFLLFQYNGNTRLQWLWLVLTNNAYVTDTQSAPPSGSSGSAPGGGGEQQAQIVNALTTPRHSGSGVYQEAY